MKLFFGFFASFILGILLCLDLLTHSGLPITYDAPVHIATIAQFYSVLQKHEFPVRWTNDFANYGLPLPLFAHQLPAYAGAFLTFFTHNPITSYTILIVLSIIFGNFFLYVWLNYNFSWPNALVGTGLYTFTAYRIQNVYLRGALPEIFASAFIITSFYTLQRWINTPTTRWWVLSTVSLALLALSHPMLLLISLPTLFIFYSIISYAKYGKILWINTTATFTIFIFGVGIAAYYLLPLVFEIKYFHQSQLTHNLVTDSFLTLQSYTQEIWPYFLKPFHPGPRGLWIGFGLFETLIIFFGIISLILSKNSKLIKKSIMLLTTSVILILLTTRSSQAIYDFFQPLQQIQFPYRFLTLLILVPPIILAMVFSRWRRFRPAIIVILIFFTIYRLNQSYGKNYVDLSPHLITQTPYNLHTVNLNPIWSDRSENYPPRKSQLENIDGQARIVNQSVSNSHRFYAIESTTPSRFVDYTFYFPGWKIYVNGSPVPIEFQDVNYKGLITFTLPQGKANVLVKYENTKIRNVSNIITLLSLTTVILIGGGHFSRYSLQHLRLWLHFKR